MDVSQNRFRIIDYIKHESEFLLLIQDKIFHKDDDMLLYVVNLSTFSKASQ